jgi:D-inositol-3-phosphate glycosyltransferase
MTTPDAAPEIAVGLLTGGGDKHYAFGLTTEVTSNGATLELIGSDEFDCPEFRDRPGVTFFNLRGDQRPDASFLCKVYRIVKYYSKLVRYAATAQPKIFHILWNNKFETFDRTLLMLYYKFLGKRIVLTTHNVNAGRRDSKDTVLNRFTLRIQYRLADHIFVHTEKMRRELIEEFDVHTANITVIPYGINNAVPNSCLTPREAKQQLGIRDGERTILFFGRITPYKGLEYLIDGFRQFLVQSDNCRLIIAGRLDEPGSENYGALIQEAMGRVPEGRVLRRTGYIPDEEIEVFFKAADILVLPYRHIYQSGILFLGYSFGLPVLAADVGSLKDDILEGKTGFVFKPSDPADLARALEQYFASDLFSNLDCQRRQIQDYVIERHSWQVVGRITMDVYARLLRLPPRGRPRNRDSSKASLDAKGSS